MRPHFFKLKGFEVLEKTVSPHSGAGRLYVPKEWVGKKAAIVRLE